VVREGETRLSFNKKSESGMEEIVETRSKAYSD